MSVSTKAKTAEEKEKEKQKHKENAKWTLEQEELQRIASIQQVSQNITFEFGSIELAKRALEAREGRANDALDALKVSENELVQSLSEKYGDWILFDPPVKKKTYLLWSLPYIFFVIGGIAILFIFKKVLKHKKY